MVPQNCSVSHILQNIFLCVQQNKDIQTGWNYSRVSKWWQNFHFWVNYPFNTKWCVSYDSLWMSLHCGFDCWLSRLSLTGIWHCYWEYSSLKGKPDSDITISDIGFQTDFRVYLQLSQTWLIFSEIWVFVVKFKSDNASQTKQCSCTFKFKDMKSLVWWKWLTAWYFTAVISLAVIEAIVILVLIFLRNRVRIAIALLKEGSK